MNFNRTLACLLVIACVVAAPVPTASAEDEVASSKAASTTLLTPPPTAQHLVIHSTGGKHGDSWVWRTAEGNWAGRDTWNLRGMVTDTDLLGQNGVNGLPANIAIHGVTPSGDATETFTLTGSKGQWKSPTDAGTADNTAGRFYLTLGGPTGATNAWFLETLLQQPNHTLALLPAGTATAE